MAFTYTYKTSWIAGNKRHAVFDLVFDTSYAATPGEDVSLSALGLSEVFYATVQPVNAAAWRLNFGYDYTNNRIVVTYPTGGSIAAPAAIGDPVLNAGGTAVTASAATGPFLPGRGKEVLAATDLSSVTVRLYVVGA